MNYVGQLSPSIRLSTLGRLLQLWWCGGGWGVQAEIVTLWWQFRATTISRYRRRNLCESAILQQKNFLTIPPLLNMLSRNTSVSGITPWGIQIHYISSDSVYRLHSKDKLHSYKMMTADNRLLIECPCSWPATSWLQVLAHIILQMINSSDGN